MAYTKICAGISGKNVACSIKITDNRQYCGVYHEHYQELINTGHTKETIPIYIYYFYIFVCQPTHNKFTHII